MLFVVPAHDGLVIMQELIGVVGVITIAVNSNLKHITSSQVGPYLECKLSRREMVGFKHFGGTTVTRFLQCSDNIAQYHREVVH